MEPLKLSSLLEKQSFNVLSPSLSIGELRPCMRWHGRWHFSSRIWCTPLSVDFLCTEDSSFHIASFHLTVHIYYFIKGPAQAQTVVYRPGRTTWPAPCSGSSCIVDIKELHLEKIETPPEALSYSHGTSRKSLWRAKDLRVCQFLGLFVWYASSLGCS
jgi:hypothetical protein